MKPQKPNTPNPSGDNSDQYSKAELEDFIRTAEELGITVEAQEHG